MKVALVAFLTLLCDRLMVYQVLGSNEEISSELRRAAAIILTESGCDIKVHLVTGRTTVFIGTVKVESKPVWWTKSLDELVDRIKGSPETADQLRLEFVLTRQVSLGKVIRINHKWA